MTSQMGPNVLVYNRLKSAEFNQTPTSADAAQPAAAGDIFSLAGDDG